MNDKQTSAPNLVVNLMPSKEQAPDDSAITRLENTLAPGFYWRAKQDCRASETSWSTPREVQIHGGDVHLMLDVVEHENEVHSIVFLAHPRTGGRGEYRMLVADFVAHFEPIDDEEAARVRQHEQQNMMQEVHDIQNEMAQAQANPMAIEDLRTAAQKAAAEYEQQETSRVMAEVKERSEREADLRRIHRRAARRSQAAGNPLSIRSATISDKIEVMVSEGLNTESVRELSLEAGRRIAMAEATAKWLTERTNTLSSILKGLTPYYAEQGQVAIAKARKAMIYVKDLTQGIQSLKLYTGEGTTIVTVREGESAPTHEPLSLLQAKRYMDEELALFVDVHEDFDASSSEFFFRVLRENDGLLQQILPLPRCVISMAATRREIDYGEKISDYERALKRLANKSVFLLVRDGANVHVVYSSEPSHEMAHRLFPTQSELEGVFQGIDGSKIGLQDVIFGKAAERFSDLSIHYKRFLILLCGLDHQHKLFGEFYPPNETMSFMRLEFQQRYFRFIAEDEHSQQLSHNDALTLSAEDWIRQCNQAVRSGSRIMAAADSLGASSPQVQRIYGLKVDSHSLPSELIVSESKGRFTVSVPTRDRAGCTGSATAFLDDENGRLGNWFLCVDRVDLNELRGYIWDRKSRVASIGWLRLLRRAERLLTQIAEEESGLRQYLQETAMAAGVRQPEDAHRVMINAISTWRADHRGAPAPSADNHVEVNKILSLMYPAERLADSITPLIDHLIASGGHTPLRLSRTGKNRLVLYVVPTDSDRAPYTTGVPFGWVKRLLLDTKKSKLTVASESMAWLKADKPNPAEEVLRDWDGIASWLNTGDEPVSLAALRQFTQALMEAQDIGPVLKAGRGNWVSLQPAEQATPCLPDDWHGLLLESKLSSNPLVTLPVGVYTRAADSKPAFVYAHMDATWFIRRYGSESQWLDLSKYYSRLDKYLASREKSSHWRLVALEQPLKSFITDEQDLFKIPKHPVGWRSVARRIRGGLKRRQLSGYFFGGEKSTRASRRANPKPRHGSADSVQLSWSRAFDALMGKAPHLRRQWYASVEDRIRFIRWEADSEAKRKIEKAKPYVPDIPAFVDLSPLVWSSRHGRSMANAFFALQDKQD